MPETDRRLVFEAGPWTVDLYRRELRSNGIAVPIGDRAFEIIEVLVRSMGALVTKEELLASVWPKAIVEENTLQVHVSAVRKAFGPDRSMLRTVSGRGYRLLGNWASRHGDDPAGMAGQGPPAVPGQPYPTNLPLATSDLIGRAAATRNVRDLLSAYRVITLTGPGGIGKTRLALEAVREVPASFRDGTWLVELASLSDPALVPSAVASTLGLSAGTDEISASSVAAAIGGRGILLVLDNCEHLIDATASLVEAVVRMCPRTSVLATSRELLGVDGEHVYRVAPLDVPPRDRRDQDELLRHSAVTLFIARTSALGPGFSPDQEAARSIATICRSLDGIPLAIELAAARAATLGVDQVLSHLDNRFELLTGGRRTALPRHQTLRATLDWSHELLPGVEQILLRRLAVFAGGFTLEAATAVMSESDDVASTTMDDLANLITKSLVILDASASGTRWRLLETTRAYALEKLAESGDAQLVARRHAVFFRDLFAPAAWASGPLFIMRAMVRHAQELDNVRAALDWCFSEDGDHAIGAVITAEYVPVWLHLLLFTECRTRAEHALDIIEAGPSLNQHLRMRLQIELGSALLQSTAIGERTGKVLTDALRAAEALNDADGQLRTLWAMWSYLHNNGDHRAARHQAERFSAVARHTGELADILVGDRLVGITLHYQGDQAEAREYLERVLARYVGPSDQRHMLWFQHDQRVVTRAMLARVQCLRGLLDQASENARASLESARITQSEVSLRYVLGWCMCPVALMTGDLAAAEQSVAMLCDLAARYQLPFWKNVGRGLEGTLLIRRGEFAAGSALLRATPEKVGATSYIMRNPEFLGVLAEAEAGLGRHAEALATIDEALERSNQTGEHWYEAELLRAKGELLSRTGQGGAETCLLDALAVARQQGALLWELRAAVSFALLKLQEGQPDAARQLLGTVYSRFTEGFEATDLRSAKTLLDTLA